MVALRNILDKILRFLSAISFLVMVILVCWQVFTRYVLSSPATWTEEFVSYMFAWMALLGSSIVFGERDHMNIPVVVDKMSLPMQKNLAILAEAMIFLFSGIVLVYGGVKIVNLAMGQMTSSLGVPVGVFYIVLPISGVLNMLYNAINIIEIVQGKIVIEPSDPSEPQ